MDRNKIVPPTTPPIITATLGKLPTYTQTAHNHHTIIYNYVLSLSTVVLNSRDR